jgi:hypothetical protein
MKRILMALVLMVSLLTFPLGQAKAADNCGVGGQLPATFDYMNAPADPTSTTAFAGAKKLGELIVSNDTTWGSFYVSPFTGQGLLPGEIETYFFYWSSDSGKSWNCTRAYASGTTVTLQPNTDYVGIVVAQARTGKGISTITKFSTKKYIKKICATGKVALSVNFNTPLKQYEVKLSHKDLNNEEKSLQYTLEVSTDNWKTKAVFKDPISLYIGYRSIKPLKDGVSHQFRLVPNASQIYVIPSGLVSSYTTSGCSPLEASASTVDSRTECEKNPGLDKCQYTVVPGENSEASPSISPTPKATPSLKPTPISKRVTITCVKGKLTRKVIGFNPVCPRGYTNK